MYLAASVALVFPVSSCIRERNFETYAPEPEAISFVIGGYSTRAELKGTQEEVPRVNRYSLGTDDRGNLFTLEETVTRMDPWDGTPATRGTPAYTENVQDVHGSAFRGIIFNPETGASLDDGEYEAMEDGIRWRRVFGFDPWTQHDPLTFFLSMPTAATGLSNIAFNHENGKFLFDYETPATAQEQQDILFARRSLTNEVYQAEQGASGGAALLFRHALTGVKFAIGNNETDEDSGIRPEGKVETFITRVEITGLKSRGSAVFDPDETVETTADNISHHSSRMSFTWTPDDSSTGTVFSQSYSDDDIQDYAAPTVEDGELVYDEGDKVHGPASFYAAGNSRNLNKNDGSLTFWFIPQTITADVKLRVTFYVWDGVSEGEEVTKELNLGERINAREDAREDLGLSDANRTWYAGELRTFTLTPTAVDVEITQERSDEDENVLLQPDIRNTGNKNAYIRVAIVGNWVDAATGEIVMGSDVTTTVGEDDVTAFTPISAWTETNTSFGTFTNLPTSSLWVKKSDGYWYFTDPVLPGLQPGQATAEGTDVPLFTSYVKGTPPVSSVELDLMLDVAVQAVDARAGANYEAAWQAVGVL